MLSLTEHPITIPKRINSHSKLSDIVRVFEAPPVKEPKRMKPISNWERNVHISRMKVAAEYARNPDMNLTLKEILTGERVSDKIAMSLFVYFAGVFFIFLNK